MGKKKKKQGFNINKIEGKNKMEEMNNEIVESNETIEGLPKMTLEQVLSSSIIKLDLGGGNKPAEGYVNVDIQYFENVDLILDVTKLHEHFGSRSVDGIMCRDTLQCFKFSEVRGVLRNWHKVMRPRSKIIIQCYDFNQVVESYLNKKCECWSAGTRMADPECKMCHGESIMNDAKFRSILFGSLKDDFRTHHNCYDEKYLVELLKSVGFSVQEISHPEMRIRIVALKEK